VKSTLLSRRDLDFLLYEWLQVDELTKRERFAEHSRETFDGVLNLCEQLATKYFAPHNKKSDANEPSFDGEKVTVIPEVKEALDAFAQADLISMAMDQALGGAQLPMTVAEAGFAWFAAANVSTTGYLMLTIANANLLAKFASPDQIAAFLKPMLAGRFSGTMALSETQAGSSLADILTRAEPQDDGTYRLFGSKMWISGAEHELTDNIVNLVLAKISGGPPGTKGISLFIVPKYLPNADGTPGKRNNIFCGAIEEKMGIHGNSTCQMNMDAATGWLIGEPNKGLNAMFVMMNAARLGVGMQSLGLTEVAYQNALIYAKDRLQMRSLSGPKAPDKPADPIIVHPDVRRMLLTAKAYAEGGRAFTSYIALQIDRELNHPDEEVRKEAADEVALLTPIIKAFLTDNGWISTSEAMQVFGGHGYIAEWGMEQYVRDARINMIYEGTNTIQSLDLLGRKILMDNGAKLRKFGEKIKSFVEENGTDEAMSEFITPLGDLGDKVGKLTMEIGMKAFQNQDEVGAAAVPYLRVVGHLVYSYFFAQMAKIALEKQDSGDSFYKAKLATARFYFGRLQPETAMLIRQARSGAANLMALEADLF
jgi:alkylation response protein AidB-like acyl-CoA dehydrogenase